MRKLFSLSVALCTLMHISIITAQELPDYVLPSPQVHQVTKYGDIPVDESSGRISPSIPLYNYRAGALSLPISLSYSGSGVKISDLPTWTGNNWTLNAGGVISRIVKDLPDETNKPRVFHDDEDLAAYLIGNDQINSDIRNLITNEDEYDTEADLFNFSFAGYSGSFYLDVVISGYDSNSLPIKDITAHLTKKDSELKIEVEGDFHLGATNHYEFIITTPSGERYVFGGFSGGDYAIEETQFVDRSGSQPVFGERSKTAFHLTRIENHLGDVIHLEYHTKAEYEVLSYKNQTLSKEITLPDPGALCIPESAPQGGISSIKKVKNVTYNGKFLKRIWSTSSPAITFTSSEIQTSNQYYRLLKDIDFTTKTVDLAYWPNESNIENSQDKDRFFLEEVIFKDAQSLNVLNKYVLEYNDLQALPGLDSFAQDHLGYYNGVNGNANLLPKEHTKYLNIHLPELPEILLEKLQFNGYSDLLADRSSHFEYATKGLLEKIHHPTGGYTEFEYEPIDKKFLRDSHHMSIHSNMGQATPAWTPNSKFYDTAYISDNYFIDENTLGQSVYTTQGVTFKVKIEALSASGLDYHDYLYLEVLDLTTGASHEERFHFPSTVPANDNEQKNFFFTHTDILYKDHNYSFKIGFGDNYAGHIDAGNQNSHFSQTPMHANVSFSYVTATNGDDGIGFRIKRVKDFESNGVKASHRRYYYDKAIDVNGEDINNKVNVYAPFFISVNHLQGTCDPDPLDTGTATEFIYKDVYYAVLNSNALALNLPESDAMSYYRNVTISYGGDYFEKGGVEKQFRVVPNEKPVELVAFMSNNSQEYNLLRESTRVNNKNHTNQGAFNGLIEKETIFLKKDGLLFKQNQKDYDYDFVEQARSKNITGSKIVNGTSIVPESTRLDDLYLGTYATMSRTSQLKQIREKNFIDLVPLSVYIPPVLEQGWQTQDEDGDGVNNFNDDDFITPDIFATLTEEVLESPYGKVEMIQSNTYDPSLAGLPLSTILFGSDGQISKTYNTYPVAAQVASLSNLGTVAQQAYSTLESENRIGSPIQVVSSVVNASGYETTLSTVRSLYKEWNTGEPGDDSDDTVLLEKVQTLKGSALTEFEDRVEYVHYDERGNPMEIKKTDGSSVLYVWSYNRTPILKIDNCNYLTYDTAISGSGIEINENITLADIISLASLLPNAQILKYDYIAGTDYIEAITDPRGNRVTYHYDPFYRLEYVKDKDGKILSKNEYNYTTQN